MNDTTSQEELPEAPFDDEATVEVPEVDPEQKIVHSPDETQESEKA